MRPRPRKEIEAILRLDGPARLQHFVKRVVDSEEVWGLRNDGWALMVDDQGQSIFPLWPVPEYAELCAVGEWTTYAPDKISLFDLVENLLPKLLAQAILPGVFPTPTGKGITPTVLQLTGALRAEMQKYE